MQAELKELQAINSELSELQSSDEAFEEQATNVPRPIAATATKSTKTTTTAGGARAGTAGESYVFDLGAKRRITVNVFAGKKRVDLREFYEDESGELKPGKKGISLSLEQYELLKSVIPRVDDALKRL